MRIIFATNNPNKLAEMRHALGNRFELVSLAEAGFEGEIPETGRTLEANALQKATYIFDRLKQPVFADDTGLEVNALHGAPGVDTAYYAGSRDPLANMAKLLEALKEQPDRSAKFRTVIAFVSPEHKELFIGEVFGSITTAMLGAEGFGYDPVFLPQGSDLTFAEMGMAAKKQMNHRVRALEKLITWIERRMEG
jgi:XTP/dITP diphosphohydrolase